METWEDYCAVYHPDVAVLTVWLEKQRRMISD